MLKSMETAATLEPQPIIIYRSVNREGQTFALEPMSKLRLRAAFGDSLHLHPRVFIAHESPAEIDELRTELATQVVRLLTGAHANELDALGGVRFRDSSTERELRTVD